MSKATAAGAVTEDVIPLLVEVGQGLDQDMSLEALARDFGASPFQFHRLFRAAVGETPKRHVDRLRLERAAYKLAITEDNVLHIALAVGFHSHETFSRAFRRRFGRSPAAYRGMAKSAQRERMARNRGFTGDGCRLSETRFKAMRPTPALAIRHVGAYADLDPAALARAWDELIGWARLHEAEAGPLRLCLFPDDPTLTPGSLQQCDICIPIARRVAGSGRLRCIELVGGLYAAIEHVGPPSTVSQAYRSLADAVRASGRYVFREDPPIQVYHAAGEAEGWSAGRSEVMFPVRPKP